MKKTFYEVLWDLCEHEGLVQKWKDEGLLLVGDSRLTWHPKVAEILKEDLTPIGGLRETVKTNGLEVALKNMPKQPKKQEDIPWIKDFIAKFNAKNIGVTAKTTDVGTVQAKMHKFLAKYQYTKEEIFGATDLYIDTLRRKGSLTYIRECGYFIFKKIDGIDQSDLANWCEQFKDNGGQSSGYNSRHLI